MKSPFNSLGFLKQLTQSPDAFRKWRGSLLCSGSALLLLALVAGLGTLCMLRRLKQNVQQLNAHGTLAVMVSTVLDSVPTYALAWPATSGGIMAFAGCFDVPEAHLKSRSAMSDFGAAATDSGAGQGRVHSGKSKPDATFVAVTYRDHWFWIAASDWQTKRALTAVMFFFTLADTGGNEKLPLITIPAQ